MKVPPAPWLAAGGAVLYCVAVTWYLITHGGWPTPDFLIPPLLVLALLLGRGRTFLLDWAPFLALLLAWEATRGVADRLGMPVHITAPIAAEKALFFGRIPTLELQRWLYDPERGARWYDWVGVAMHSLHFVLPVVFGFALWLRDRALYWRYVASVLALFLLGFAGFVLFPQAPPWLAQPLGADVPYAYRVGVGSVLCLPIEGHVTFLYRHIRPNSLAAMPSLHAALPLLLTLILWRVRPSLAWVGFLYTAVLGFFLVYHGEHYVIDLIAGWALAGLVYWLVWATPSWLKRKLPIATAARRRWVTIPASAVAALLLVVGTAAVLRPGAFGQEPSALTPPPVETAPAVEEQRQPASTVEVVEAEGPCGTSRTLAGIAKERLETVARAHAAYLLDAQSGLCLALAENGALPPPEARHYAALAAQSGPPGAPAPAIVPGVEAGRQLWLVASGRPSARLSAAGFPGGQYTLIILLLDVSDPAAARDGAASVATAILESE